MDPRLTSLEKLGNATPFVTLIHSIIGHIRLFEDFDQDEIATVATYLECFRASAGTEIIAENEQGDFMLLVLDGAMEIMRQGPDGLPVRIGLAGPGKTLGE